MLQVVYTPCPKAKEQYFLKNKSQDDLWLVAHIESKRTLQDFFLQTQSTISSKSVLRASEYWQWLFTINCPEWRAVSESLIYALIEEWFDNTEMAPEFQNIEMFHRFFAQVLPLVAAPDQDLVEEWLSSDPHRQRRLSGWMQQARLFWEVLKERRWMGRSWVVSVLNLQDDLVIGDYNNIYIDLGLDLRQEEVEMILRLAREKNIVVFVPKCDWTQEYSQSLDVYKKIIEQAGTVTELQRLEAPAKVLVHQHPSVLKESKTVVAAVRELLEKGVPAARIGVFSSNIEDYWDILREHFLVEGVPVNKKYVLRAVSLPAVQTWLAQLHLHRGDFEQAHLESYLFNEYSTPLAWSKYDDFRRDFSNVYDASEARDYFGLKQERLNGQKMSFVEFVNFIFSKWPLEDREVADEISDLMAKDLRMDDSFTFDLWLKYLELVVSRAEEEIRGADEKGVVFGNFSQADWVDLDHAFVLGCAQNRLREHTPSPLTMEDIARAEFDLGFYLQRNENLKKEFELRWFCEKDLKTLSLSHSHSDFEGHPQTAASVWLAYEAQGHMMPIPGRRTRWDQLMAQDIASLKTELQWDDSESTAFTQKFSTERDIEAYAPLKTAGEISVSASSLKTYFNCPFQFYSGKILDLDEPREHDLDTDPFFQGHLLHRIAEEISKTYPNYVVPREDLSALYDRIVKEGGDLSPLGRFWLQEKPRHLILIQNFIDLEKEWREKFPNFKTVATEAPFSGFIGVVNGEVQIRKDNPGGFFKFTGRIDRIDRGPGGQLVVIDYKTSAFGLLTFKNWPANGLFQMPLYAMAIEAGLCEGVDPAPVVAANYICFRDKIRGKGYVVEGDHGFGDIVEGRSSQVISIEEKDRVFGEILNEIKVVLSQIESGDFAPRPRDEKNCEKCDWRRLCRAPHLK